MITEFTGSRSKGGALSITYPFQLISFTFRFVGVTAEFDRVENGWRWGAGRLKMRLTVCEEGDFGVIRWKKLRPGR